jgi:ABC-type polysaccharide/polyol phosphate export permease
VGIPINEHWIWLPALLVMEIVFVCGLALLFSGLNVYVRDTRYVVESVNLVLWWLVPIIYPFAMIPQQYKDIYQYNPIAAIVLAMREIILEGHAPSQMLVIKLLAVSAFMLVLGWFTFNRMERRFYNYL